MASKAKEKQTDKDLIEIVDSNQETKGKLVPVFNLDNLNPALLPELATFKEKQLKVVEDNPFVKITDSASRELAKKHRTARVSARTALQAQDKLISSKFNEAKTKAKTYIAELIEYTQPGEIEQQKEIDRDEAELEAKRKEKARLEQQRIDNIKAELDKYSEEWKDAFNLMTFQTMENIGDNFVESYTSYDTTILQEFESLFPAKVEELTKILEDKRVLLITAEEARLEKVRLEEEAKILAQEKADLEAKVKLAEEAEARAKAEREKLEKDKAEFEEKQQAEKQKSAYQLKVDNRIAKLVDLGLKFDFQSTFVGFDFFIDVLDIKTYEDEKWNSLIAQIEEKKSAPSPEILKGIEVEEKALELVQNTIPETAEEPVISAPENTTASVCKPFEQAIKEISESVPSVLAETPLTPKECFVAPTWDSIIEDFKTSGEKSYSLWLKNNYNVPTKIS